jgi:hypothetical protein
MSRWGSPARSPVWRCGPGRLSGQDTIDRSTISSRTPQKRVASKEAKCGNTSVSSLLRGSGQVVILQALLLISGPRIWIRRGTTGFEPERASRRSRYSAGPGSQLYISAQLWTRSSRIMQPAGL